MSDKRKSKCKHLNAVNRICTRCGAICNPVPKEPMSARDIQTLWRKHFDQVGQTKQGIIDFAIEYASQATNIPTYQRIDKWFPEDVKDFELGRENHLKRIGAKRVINWIKQNK